ncbi:sigma 54-interacting transcriptional regulator, partial [Klebsiella pneumoniae]
VAPGAYTGAERKGRDGKFKLADGGTLFLDEIGDMPLALQSKLLRVLQEQEVEPLGSNTVMRIDVRVIAATSRDLAAMVAAGSFR